MNKLNFKYFNNIQTQIFNDLYQTNNNLLLCAPSYCGKTICAEVAILKILSKYPNNGKCVYITPIKSLAIYQFNKWIKKQLCNNIILLTNDTKNNILRIKKNESMIIISNDKYWYNIQNHWNKNKVFVNNIDLFIIDKLDLIGYNDNNYFNGTILECCISRQKYIFESIQSTNMLLKPILIVIELCQMIIQSCWKNYDCLLLQLQKIVQHILKINLM